MEGTENNNTLDSLIALLESTFSFVWNGPNKMVKVVNENGTIFVHFATKNNTGILDLSITELKIIEEVIHTGYFRPSIKISGPTVSFAMTIKVVDEVSLSRLAQAAHYLSRYYV